MNFRKSFICFTFVEIIVMFCCCYLFSFSFYFILLFMKNKIYNLVTISKIFNYLNTF